VPHRNRFSWSRLSNCHSWTRNLTKALADESGQDLIEYAIVIALISLAATASMNGVAASISNAFTVMSGHISTYTS
jgi:pilus assembly protein Flp/PilA